MMNQIKWLEQNITKIKEFAAEDQARLEQNPDSLAAQLAYASTKGHLADLEQQLHELRADHAS